MTQQADRADSTKPTGSSPADEPRSDWRIAGAVFPTLFASVLGLLPFTVYSTFLVSIADAVGDGDAAVGALRGLGGIGAVVVGVAVAPLIGAVAPGRVAAWGLVLLAAAALVGTVAWLPALAAFCLLVGVSNAVLYPALTTAAADRFGTGPNATRAATLVTATKTLAATLVAPLVALPALWWGWRGDLIAIAVVAVVLTPVLLRYGRERHVDETAPRHGYFGAFRALAAVPGARALLLVSFGQAAAFQGYLAYLAAFYADEFGLSPSVFAFVWTLSGGSFFLGNLVAGRVVNATESDGRAVRALHVFLTVALVSLFGVFLAPTLPLALTATAILSASHAVGVAAVVTLLVRRAGTLRGTALAVNASGMSMGLFLGAAAGGVGLAAGGYLAAAAVFGVFTALSVVAALTVRQRGRT
ncbi:MFS transporter [Actinophytocola oryzae]|uniref:Putative MFS family arabinose efflux permease n=1 Tax=Actinophytocola oryzae TaxID=502181 RepID=A0A4R7V4F5_9PSEU|nr:MFS transporter [Actinophytocola oryzae]TDV44229.1 putative MFS family arabinose efflux permease [Actinophytocola oryzae]